MSVSSGDNGQDFDLNLAPIIDCFTVLIAYLLVSASFISLAVFDVGVAVSGEGAAETDSPKDPPYFLSLQILEGKTIEIKISGGPEGLKVSEFVKSRDSKNIDYLSLKEKLDSIKLKYPRISELSVSAQDGVAYRDIVSSIETSKASFPKVFLSGEQVIHTDRISSKDETTVQ